MQLENLCEMTIWHVLKNPQQRRTSASQIKHFPDVLLKSAFPRVPPDVVILPSAVTQNNSALSLSVTSRILTFPPPQVLFSISLIYHFFQYFFKAETGFQAPHHAGFHVPMS